MDKITPNSVLRRKAVAAREVWQARAMSPAKALRLSFARAADSLWDLAAAASGIDLSELDADTALAGLNDKHLIVLLEGPEGHAGAMTLDFALVSGLVEAQTMGRISPQKPEDRKPTRTDAAMIAPLVDDTLTRFEALLEENGGSDLPAGFRFGVMFENVRMLSLALKATDFHVIRFSADLNGVREGEAVILLPVFDDIAEAMTREDSQSAGGALGAQVMQVPAELDAVLFRMRMPFSKLNELAVGDVLPIPREALDETQLVVSGQNRIALSKLGQMNGLRAVRLILPDSAATSGGDGEAGIDDPNDAKGRGAAKDQPADLPGMDLPGMDLPGLGGGLGSPTVQAGDDTGFPAMAPMGLGDLGGDEPTEAAAGLGFGDTGFGDTGIGETGSGDPDLLGDLPPLGDLPDLGSFDSDDSDGGAEEDNAGDLPDIGAFPMASLPEID